jgi:hypothetical protein
MGVQPFQSHAIVIVHSAVVKLSPTAEAPQPVKLAPPTLRADLRIQSTCECRNDKRIFGGGY